MKSVKVVGSFMDTYRRFFMVTNTSATNDQNAGQTALGSGALEQSAVNQQKAETHITLNAEIAARVMQA